MKIIGINIETKIYGTMVSNWLSNLGLNLNLEWKTEAKFYHKPWIKGRRLKSTWYFLPSVIAKSNGILLSKENKKKNL